MRLQIKLETKERVLRQSCSKNEKKKFVYIDYIMFINKQSFEIWESSMDGNMNSVTANGRFQSILCRNNGHKCA